MEIIVLNSLRELLLDGENVMSAPVKAYFMAIVKRGTEHDVAENLRKIGGVTDVLVTYGMWDVVARIETESLRKLDIIITDLRKINEITQTSTLVGA